MKNTKLIIAGLTAAMTLSGASAVFAEDTTDSSTQAFEKTDTRSESFREMKMDMSALELPEDFIPFDEAHIPDGFHAPENGELKPIEFDKDGNMINGQKPPMFDEMERQQPEFTKEDRPESAEGERPVFPGRGTQGMNGQRTELPEGEMPALEEGERPELPEGEMPALEEGERPELPEGEMPVFEEGQRPELPEGEMPVFEEGQRPELPAGEMPAFTEGEMPEMQQGGMPFGGSREQMKGKNI